MQSKISRVTSCALVIFVLGIGAAPALRAQKLKPEEVIAKHLASIGPAEKLKAIKSRTTTGTAHVEWKVGGSANLTGPGEILSDGAALRGAMNFPALEYRGEQFVFDGERASIAMRQPGVRSPLGQFLYENDVILKEGFLFGTLSTSWAFLNTATRQPKLTVNGPKKMGNRSVYEVKYEAKKGKGNVTAFFYFDSETFRHVRSQYKVDLTSTQIAKISDTQELDHYTLVEEFGEFKEVDGLTLPHSYKLDFTFDSPRNPFLGNWEMVINQVGHNQAIDHQVFAVK